MLTIFNRRELITLSSQQRYFRVKEALSCAGITHYTRTHGMLGFGGRSDVVLPGMSVDAMYTYTIYVHRSDLHRASEAIRQALQNEF